jgi:eukaryotic-like serine/threonine-protein kinase
MTSPQTPMPPSPGTRLGPYELVSPLGSGGMGDVFVARDTRLDRRVAIKIVRTPALAVSADARGRFEREARAIASLNHPHICTLHDVGRDGDVEFLVMELLEGETLAQRLERGRLPVREVIDYALQIADALEAAHRHGIVHRDLKPANVMLISGGTRSRGAATVKLLDFGIARLKALPVEGDRLTQPVTVTGEIVGTLPYMAPEQIEGADVDSRADLFAFGAVLYEMLSGRPAFRAPTQARLVAEILEVQPPALSELRPDTPPTLQMLVEACLAKAVERRWASAADARLVLQHALAEPTAPLAGRRGGLLESLRRRPLAWILPPAGILVAVLALIVAAQQLRPQVAPPVDVLSVISPPGTTFTVGDGPQVSPDGRIVAFVATDAAGKTSIYVRERSAAAARVLPDTEDATQPFWSPDSRQLGFFARGSLKTVPVAGGRVQTLAVAAVPRGGSWSAAGDIVFVPYPNASPQRIPAAGGTPTTVPLPARDDERRWFPCFLPDGRRYLYLAIDVKRRTGKAIRLASLDSTEVIDLVASSTSAVYAEPGYLLFRRDGALVAQRFDTRSAKLQGQPVVVAEAVGFNAIGYQGFFSASRDGVIALFAPSPGWRLAWFDRFGRRIGTVGAAAQYNSVCLTGDGQHLVYDAADPATGNIDLWSLNLASGVSGRLTFDPTVDFYPSCSKRGDEVFFASLRQGLPGLYRQRISSPGSETLLRTPPGPEIPTDWSSDGRWLLFVTYNTKTSWDVWAMPIDQGSRRDPIPLAATPAEERNATFSPDGRFVAYIMQEAGSPEVMVQPFPPTGTRWQVSSTGGRQPAWSPDGGTLYYLSPDNKLMAVEVRTKSGSFAAGASRTVMETRVAGLERSSQGTSFQVAPDGQRFLIIDGGDAAVPVTLLLNWTSALK